MIKIKLVLFSCVMFFVTQIHAADWLTSFKLDEANDFIICGGCAAHPNDPNGGFVMVGYYDPGHNRFVVRIDKYGNIVWKKDLAESPPIDNAGKSADWTDDQGYLIAGNRGIYKLKSNGDLEWTANPYDYKNLCYIKKIYSTGSKYVVIGDDLTSSFIFDEATKQGSYLKTLPGRFFEVKPDGNELIFSGEDASTSVLELYKTNAVNLAPVTSFGTNGLKKYSAYKFGSAIEVCSNGTGYLVACENSSGKIKIIKTNKSGTIVSSSSWNYSPTMNIAYVTQGRKKSLGIKELSDGKVFLGGIYTNVSESDFFMQLVNTTGNTELYKRQFENLGQDADL